MTPCRRRLVVCAGAKHGHHSSFIPIKHLSSLHFPHGLCSGSALQLVRHLAQLVVRVRVVVRSETGVGMTTRTCTGVVTSVGEREVTVMVPLHAMQNNVEVHQTTVDFFYDSNDDDDIITVQGLSLVRHNHLHVAQLTCQMCPELRQCFDRWRKEMVISVSELADLDNVKSFQGSAAVLISHPHGFSKRVSFGSVFPKRASFGNDFPKRVSFGSICGEDDMKGMGDNNDMRCGKSLCDTEARRTPSERWGIVSSKCEDLTAMSSRPSSFLSSQPSLSSFSSQTSLSSSYLSSQPSSSSPCFSLLASLETLRIAGEKVDNISADIKQPTATFSYPKSVQQHDRVCVTVCNEAMGEEENSLSGIATLTWKRILSLCSELYRHLSIFTQGMFSFSENVSPKIARIYHTAASCPGSSGGAVILIGCMGLDDAVTSLPVYLHVGVERDEGVAIPIVVSGESVFLSE